MRLKGVTLGIALMTIIAGTANAGPTWLGITGGTGIPTGDYGNVANTGWNLGAIMTRQVNETWGIGADLGYHAWSVPSEYEALVGSDLSWRGFQATGHAIAKFSTQSQLTPYAKLGAGLYNMKLTAEADNSSVDENKLGINGSLGLDFPSSGNQKWGIIGSYHHVPSDGSAFNFFTFGLNVRWGVGQ
jgi:hypothetical protein